MKLKLEPRYYPHSKSTPWQVVVPRNLAGHRVRKFFSTSEEAEIYIARVLTPGIGFAKADVRGQMSINDTPGKATLAQCAHLWMGRFQSKKPSYFQIRRCLKPLIARHGRDPIDAVQVPQLDAWLCSLEGHYAYETQKNYWRRIRQFFIYCHNFGFIAKNPMTILKQPKRREPLKRFIVTADEMRQCLEVAKGNRALMAFLCLGGFGSLRPSEILKMDWDHIRWEDNEICVPKGKPIDNPNDQEIGRAIPVWEQNLARRVLFEYNKEGYCSLRAHLEPLALKGKEIDCAEQRRPDGGRGSRKIIPGGQAKLYYLLKPLRPILGVDEWPQDCLRHSYKSYHLAYFQNFERLRVQMGHASVSMTDRYGSPQRQREAVEWWAL